MNRRDFLKSTLGLGLLGISGGIFGLLKPQNNLPKTTILPASDPKKLRLGWVVYEEIGFAVINDHAVSKIVVA